jgi:cation transport regulator ChaC
MGLEGAHPGVQLPVRLAPGESTEGVVYYVAADDVEQARLYRFLREVGGLV